MNAPPAVDVTASLLDTFADPARASVQKLPDAELRAVERHAQHSWAVPGAVSVDMTRALAIELISRGLAA